MKELNQNPELIENLIKEGISKWKTTKFISLLSIWVIFLWKLTKKSLIKIGFPIGNRDDIQGSEKVIGMFVNTIPMFESKLSKLNGKNLTIKEAVKKIEEEYNEIMTQQRSRRWPGSMQLWTVFRESTASIRCSMDRASRQSCRRSMRATGGMCRSGRRTCSRERTNGRGSAFP